MIARRRLRRLFPWLASRDALQRVTETCAASSRTNERKK